MKVMIFDEEMIGQENKAAQKEVIDHKNKEDVPKVIFYMDQLGESDLGGGETHDQGKGGQYISFQGRGIIFKEEPEEKGNKKDQVAVFQKMRKDRDHPFSILSSQMYLRGAINFKGYLGRE
jgi:hypothetical protein